MAGTARRRATRPNQQGNTSGEADLCKHCLHPFLSPHLPVSLRILVCQAWAYQRDTQLGSIRLPSLDGGTQLGAPVGQGRQSALGRGKDGCGVMVGAIVMRCQGSNRLGISHSSSRPTLEPQVSTVPLATRACGQGDTGMARLPPRHLNQSHQVGTVSQEHGFLGQELLHEGGHPPLHVTAGRTGAWASSGCIEGDGDLNSIDDGGAEAEGCADS